MKESLETVGRKGRGEITLDHDSLFGRFQWACWNFCTLISYREQLGKLDLKLMNYEL